MIKKNVIAGFWLRFFAKLIDFGFVFVISIVSSYFVIEKNKVWKFKYNWLFYLWCIEIICLFLFFFIIIPILSKGKTIGNYITKTQIIENNNKIIVGIIKREIFFSGIWIFLTLFVMIVINHTLIISYSLIDKSKIQFSIWDNLRIGVVSSVGSFMIIVQMIIGISIIVRKDKRGLNDLYANTKIIRENKFIEIKESFKEIQHNFPKKVKYQKVEWI